MLKSILLALLMGDPRVLAARAEELQRLHPGSVSPERVESELRLFRLLVELDRISRLGDKLGPKLVGAEDFEEGLAQLVDDAKFAEMLGRLGKFAFDVAADPQLIERLDANFGLRAQSSAASARFAEDLEPLEQVSNLSLARLPVITGFADVRDTIEPEQLAASLLESLYDPAQTTRSSDFAWAVVRMLGRAIALRHVETQGVQASDAYLDDLFRDSRRDVELLNEVLSAMLAGDPAMRIRFELDNYSHHRNRVAIDRVMTHLDQHPEAWDEKFGEPPIDDE